MHPESSTDRLSADLHTLVRMHNVQRQASKAIDNLFAAFEEAGYSRASVERAIAIANVDSKESFSELQGAQRLLEMIHAPVQIETLSVHETATGREQALRDLYDQGFWARLQGAARTCQAADEEERSSFMRGYDTADSVLDPQNASATDG